MLLLFAVDSLSPIQQHYTYTWSFTECLMRWWDKDGGVTVLGVLPRARSLSWHIFNKDNINLTWWAPPLYHYSNMIWVSCLSSVNNWASVEFVSATLCEPHNCVLDPESVLQTMVYAWVYTLACLVISDLEYNEYIYFDYEYTLKSISHLGT